MKPLRTEDLASHQRCARIFMIEATGAKNMHMGIQIGPNPEGVSAPPLPMLKASPRRIERFLGILTVVVERAQDRSLTDEETAAIQAALQYFRVGGQRHNAD